MRLLARRVRRATLPADARPVEWEGAREALEWLLVESLLAFWDERVIDPRGGYALAVDANGRRRRATVFRLVTQARTAWFFARMARSPYGDERYHEWALHGLRYLRERMWDRRHGGFHWELSPKGVSDDRKHVYGQTFALLALSELRDDPAAAELADELLDLLDARAHDERFGGYRESFGPDWRPEPRGALGALGEPAELKTHNTHLHLLAAMSEFAPERARERDRLDELMELLSGRLVHWSDGTYGNLYREDWTPVPGWRASYGHDLECAWLLIRASAVIGRPTEELRPLLDILHANALEHGFDHDVGGFFASGPPREPADDRRKIWWVEAECLVSLLEMYRHTAEQAYRDAFVRTLDWVVRWQADRRHGEWRAEIWPDLTVRGDLAGPWKSALHQGRAVLECLDLLSA